jgi:hypothetical protein
MESWYLLNSTGSGRNTWWFGNATVSGIVGMGNLSSSALLSRLKEFQLPWSAGLSSIGLLLWRCISKTIVWLWLSRYFVGTSIFIGTTVSLVAILSCCWWETSEKQRPPLKEILQGESLLLELLRTWNDRVRLLSEVLGDQQAELPLH